MSGSLRFIGWKTAVRLLTALNARNRGVKRVPSKGTSTWPSCRVTGLPRAWIQIGYPGVAQIGAAKLKKFCRITGDGNERLRGLDR
jgi:hypothetical protein